MKEKSKSIATKSNCLKSERVLKHDPFGAPIMLNYGSDGSHQTSYRSALGACFQLIISVVTVLFTFQQASVWFYYKDTTFTATTIQDYFDQEDYKFTEGDGF